MNQLSIVIIGLSITSSWGNGHAVTFRSLVKGLKGRGHDIIFLERDVPWYAQNRDSPDNGTNCTVNLYTDPAELFANSTSIIRDADLVVVGSYVPDGIRIGQWVTQTAKGVTAFYDIDTPVTLSKMKKGRCEYLAPDLIRQYDLYLSFTGGPILNHLQVEYGASAARALYCSVDTELYRPRQNSISWDLGYLGTFSTDRQPKLHELLVEPASHLNNCRFVVAGPQYPDHLQWPENVCRINHLPPSEHCTFYNSQRLTLNITRADMVRSGWSPSIRLFEAAAC